MEDKQLTISQLVDILNKIREKHGDDILVYHCEFGVVSNTCSVYVNNTPAVVLSD